MYKYIYLILKDLLYTETEPARVFCFKLRYRRPNWTKLTLKLTQQKKYIEPLFFYKHPEPDRQERKASKKIST